MSEGHDPFTASEVTQAHELAVSACLKNAAAKNAREWSIETVTGFIGNPEDGGAMSQNHLRILLKERFGDGNYTFKRIDKSILVSPDEGAHFIVTGILERARSHKPGTMPHYVYAEDNREMEDIPAQNLKFSHLIYVNPGKTFFICKNRCEDDIRRYILTIIAN